MKLRERYLLIALFVFPWIAISVSKFLGLATRSVDIFGNPIWVTQSSVGKLATITSTLILSSIMLINWLTNYNAKKENKNRFNWSSSSVRALITGLLITLSLIVNFRTWSTTSLLFFFQGIIFVYYAFNSDLLEHSKKIISSLTVIFLLYTVLTIIFRSSSSIESCRADKCSFINGLLSGPVDHENFLALLLIFYSPFLLFIKVKFVRNFMILLSITLSLMTGARFLQFTVLILLTQIFSKFREKIAWVPLVSYLAAIVNFFTLNERGASGRGIIYAGIRKNLETNWLLGSGPSTLNEIYQERNYFNFLPYHEHNQFGHFAAMFGYPFALVIAILLYRFAKSAAWSTRRPDLYPWYLSLALLSSGFTTETPIKMAFPSPFSIAIFVMIFLFGRSLFESRQSTSNSFNSNMQNSISKDRIFK